MRMNASIALGFAIASFCIAAATACHAQALETETARFLHRGEYELGSAFEFQTSKEGTERAVPMAFEYGVTGRVSLLVEPVLYTAIRPKLGSRATGLGDLEVTGFYSLRDESNGIPALAIAVETKLPTTHDPLIGTGKADLSAFVIGSKRAGRFDAHANFGYSINGRPAGIQLVNTFSGALASEFHLTPRLELFGEVLGSTSSAPEGGGDKASGAGVKAPEAAAGELVGTAGVGLSPLPNLLLSLGVSVDNNRAVLIRPGVAFRLR